MKINWGYRMAIVMACFITMIITLGVIMSSSEDTVEESDYYEKGLKYEQRIELERNTQSLTELPKISFNASKEGLEIQMPEGMKTVSASLWLYKPDEAKMDKKPAMEAIVGNQSALIKTGSLQHGLWIAKFSWNDGARGYYMEKRLIVE
jgi:nitrogen fixation protein FixH